MFSINEVQSLLPGFKIIKQYPATGQKQVFQVQNNHNELLIAKFVKDNDLRVLREIEIVTENDLPNVPKIIDVKTINVDHDNNYICILEQFIDGETLNSRLKKEKLSTSEGIKLMDTLLHIAVKLESISVVHRDIKPDNILCHPDGDFYLIDFGIARQLDNVSLTMTQAVVGPHTPGYGAPELFQYKKKEIDIRADLFSIGVVMFEAMTGEHPFITGDELSVNEIWYKTNTVMPKMLSIEGDLNSQLISFIQTLMQKHSTRRPPNAKKAYTWFQSVLTTVEY